MRVLGVDPGVSGAIALLDTSLDVLLVRDMPRASTNTKGTRREVVPIWLVDTLREWEPDVAYVERVHSMPKQGVASSFSFGESCGVIRGVLAALGIPTHRITPNEWKRTLRLNAEKSASRAMAANLFPACSGQFSRGIDDGRAEAALLAWFGSARERAGISPCVNRA